MALKSELNETGNLFRKQLLVVDGVRFGPVELKRQKQTTGPFVGQSTGKQENWASGCEGGRGKRDLNMCLFLLCNDLRRHQVLFLSLCRQWVYVFLILGKCSPSRKTSFGNKPYLQENLTVKMHRLAGEK